MFGKALGRLSETVSRQAYGSSNVAGKATQVTIMTAAAASGNVKAKEQLTPEVRLVTPGTPAPVAAKQFRAKAKADGEDIITPLVEQAAQMLVDAALKNRPGGHVQRQEAVEIGRLFFSPDTFAPRFPH